MKQYTSIRRCLFLLSILVFARGDAAGQETIWAQTNGPVRGAVTALETAPAGPIFALASGQIYLSPDDGLSWQKTALRNERAELAVSTKGHLFAAAPVYCDVSCFQNGVFRSIDGGESWASLHVSPSDEPVAAFVAGAEGHVFALSDGLYRSVDDGESWSRIDLASIAPGVSNVRLRAVAAHHEGLVAGVTNHAAFFSADNGVSWERIPFEEGELFISRLTVSHDGTLFASAGLLLLRSDNRGRTWSALELPSDSERISAIYAAPDGHVYVGTESAGYRITGMDQGLEVLRDRGAGAFAHTDDETLLAGGRFGVERQLEDGEWAFSSSGIIESVVLSLETGVDGRVFAGSFYQGVFSTDDAGNTWKDLHFPVAASVEDLTMSDDGTLFAGIIGEPGLYRTPDAGETWMPLGLKNIGSVLAVSADTILAGAVGRQTHGLYRSIDGGEDWTQVGLSDFEVTELAAEGDDLYAGTLGHGVYRSADRGTTWSAAGLSGENIRGLVASPSGVVYAGTFDGEIYVSSDTSWTLAHKGPPSAGILTLVPTPGRVVFAATTEGVLRSIDGGHSWHSMNDGLPGSRHRTSGLAVDAEGYLYVGTWGEGVFRSTEAVATTLEEPIEQLPGRLTSLQNHPNPFRDRTTISYELRHAGRVRLVVYDILGRAVETLVDGSRPAGRHEVVFEAGGLASGVYFYQLQAGRTSRTHEMIVTQ